MSLSTTSTHFLNTSTAGDCTTSLGSLFQCPTNLSDKFFLTSNLSLPWHNLRPNLLILLSSYPFLNKFIVQITSIRHLIEGHRAQHCSVPKRLFEPLVCIEKWEPEEHLFLKEGGQSSAFIQSGGGSADPSTCAR